MTKRTLVLAAALCTAAAFGQTTSDPNDNPIQVLNHPTPPATQFLTTNSSWQSLPYQQGAMLFTDTKTKRTAILGNVTHQDPQSGAWVQNDPSLSSTNNGWRIDGTANQILIDKSGTSLHIVTQTYTDYATKHNSVLGVTFPTLTYDSGFLFHFTQNGLTWDLRFRQAGFFEFEATVATKGRRCHLQFSCDQLRDADGQCSRTTGRKQLCGSEPGGDAAPVRQGGALLGVELLESGHRIVHLRRFGFHC
jgi:hypothetical protein